MAPLRKRNKQAAAPPSAAPASQNASTSKTGGIQRADWKEGFRKKQAGVSDMTLLSTISNESINDNLKKRFENADIYTYIGHVLISVNPFRMLPIYDDKTLKSYRNKNRLEMPPHVYAIAEAMYYNMLAYKENQCVIISGESGAGKTEAAKKIMEYIAAVAGADGPSGINQIKEMVLATNPLLESFGCAKTLRNNNSSRHGKYLEIEFNDQGIPIGAMITNYLLEKNRVVGQIRDERNFHIFYQFTKGASAQQREAYGIQEPSAYAYTSKAGCLSVDGIDDVSDWNDTLQAMSVIGISAQEQDSILRTLATILWLGNVTFAESDDGNAYIPDESVPNFVAYLMEAEASSVTKALTQRIMETARGGGRRGSVYEVPMNPAQAAAARDALAKSIYDHLFDWIVLRVNQAMKSKEKASLVIGVLDIYGFEIFQNNSFEQLCINYVNEKLQQIFIQLTLKTEQEEYVREQIKWTPIDYFNNKVVCDLIEEKRPPGVFAALNDACATAHADPTAADASFVQRLSSLSSNQYFESRGDKFLIKHYAGDVTYNISGMTDKNKDTLSKELLELVISSPNKFFSQEMFPERPDPDNKKRPPTAGDRIKTSANLLVEKLMRSQPSYIRTIKPNQNKSPTEYDSKAILHQIKYLGLQENIRVRRAGFAYRNTFEKMVERFYLLSKATSYAGDYIWQGDPKTACQQILKDTGVAKEEWQMGVTKAFIKNPETLFALEHMRDRYWHNMASRIQRAFRNYLRYKQECAQRIQRFWKNKKDGLAYVQLRDYSHQVLGGRKERRRYSLVSMRQFKGDYLDVGGRSPLGEMLKGACGIAPSEQVIFSMNAQVLVSKLGRSSKPSPRYLIMTGQAIYLAITTLAGGRPTTTLERKIPLMTIRSVGLSNLRDDWIAINVQSQEEDPFVSCIFKTEFITHLLQQTNGAISVNISSQVEYTKKKDKKTSIKFVKDDSVPRGDVYKSQTVSVPSGESPSSQSMPPARRIAGTAKPISSGKLLRAGGPSGPTSARPAQARSAPAVAVAPRPAPILAASNPTSRAAPALAASIPKAPTALAAPIPKPPAANLVKPVQPPSIPSQPQTSSIKKPPPAPPAKKPAPAPPSRPQYKCLYNFDTTESGEISLVKDEVVELVQKDPNGWWLIKKKGVEGWAPSNYLEEVINKAAPPRPAPPKPSLKPNGVNGLSSNSSPASSRPGSSIGSANGAADLAAALRARASGQR